MDARKRGRSDAAAAAAVASNGAASKRLKESETGIGSKLKPCNKFFSTAGCPFGEGCHFAHFVPGGIKSASQMLNSGDTISARPSRNPKFLPGVPDGPPTPGAKTRLCNKFNTAEGCKFGDKCHFAHGERELGRPAPPSHDGFGVPPMAGRYGARFEQPPVQPAGLAAAASFGASATAKISVDASLAGAIIGKGGLNTKQIVHVTGAKLSIRDHETDPNLKNIELEGTFDQIKHASTMVRELIVNISTSASTPFPPSHSFSAPQSGGGGVGVGVGVGVGGKGNNIKTKLCGNFAKGSCTFGDRCHFAHGESELRKPAA